MNHFPRTVIGMAAFALAAAGFVAVFGTASAHAQESCGITAADIMQIKVIQSDPSLSPSQEVAQELSLRKQLVGQTIVCAKGEVRQLQAALAAASTTDPVGETVQSHLAGDLDGAGHYYDLELAKLDTAGIAGTQAIAQEVLAWRAGTFVPLSENVNNFILWAGNQGLFTTARTRMDQTQSAVSFLESATPNADLQTAFNGSLAAFDDAETANVAARTALAQNLAPGQSLALIKQSLNALAATYQDFFTVSTLIKGILPQ